MNALSGDPFSGKGPPLDEPSSPSMAYAEKLCRLYAPIRRPVMLVGPVGAGKTRLAKLIHQLSRRNGDFVSISAGEITESLYRDTLFGHVPGAYTGAGDARKGAFARAAGGTLFLDDLAFMPLEAQAALLRVLEDRHFLPLGAARELSVTCREIFAATGSPERLVEEGKLLPDLESRVGELVIRVPGLSERREEIPSLATTLAEAFLRDHQCSGEVEFSDRAMALLLAYEWPRNVRELKAVVERAVVHAGMGSEGTRVEAHHLPDRFVKIGSESASDAPGVTLTPAMVQWALAEAGGNKSEAARRLGVHRNTISRYLKDSA